MSFQCKCTSARLFSIGFVLSEGRTFQTAAGLNRAMPVTTVLFDEEPKAADAKMTTVAKSGCKGKIKYLERPY